ncbi:MAG: hypothetical protein JOY71_28350 [Acetobacteraceae bacterium]|nr:hypothetical protein [Acetobacteraceae bacterium]
MLNDIPDDPARRGLLQAAARYGLTVPAVYLAPGRAKTFVPFGRVRESAKRAAGPCIASDPDSVPGDCEVRIVRDFIDPYLELLRLLRDATEIEHALMVQYLFAAFSLKPGYESLVGYGDPNATTLLGVAIQEMQHLAVVNRFLVALGGAPNLAPQEFPFDVDIYPFTFNLEPLSRETLAKYVFAEAPPGILDSDVPKGDDVTFVNSIWALLGPEARVNHLGSLYKRIIALTRELEASGSAGLPALTPWVTKLEAVMNQGEVDHYHFFRSVFMGTHGAFKGHPDIWNLPPLDPVYPAMPLERNPSAYVGHPRQIRNPTGLSIAWLGNLHYWIVLCLLDLHFRETSTSLSDSLLALAEAHMQGPLKTVGQSLPTLGVGLPFDPLGTGYAPGLEPARNRRFIMHLLAEADQLEKRIEHELTSDFPAGVSAQTAAVLQNQFPAASHQSQ